MNKPVTSLPDWRDTFPRFKANYDFNQYGIYQELIENCLLLNPSDRADHYKLLKISEYL